MDQTITDHWKAYVNARDRGHTRFVEEMEEAERFFIGEQWNPAEKKKLGDRPALTVNMILATMATAFGQMLENYTEVSFFSKDSRYDALSKVLGAVTKGIYQDNRIRWLDMDMAMDGFIGGRGYLDVRMGFKENLRGDVVVTKPDPRDILLDPEARTPLPDGWKEVFSTRWLTLDEIEAMYGKAKAKALRSRPMSSFPDTYDAIQASDMPGVIGGEDANYNLSVPPSSYEDTIPRRFRIVERQYKKLDSQEHFVDVGTGETRPVPATWDEERVFRVMQAAALHGVQLSTIRRLAERIRMTVVAADVMLYDDWSPYPCFTIVPYFPYFRLGKTLGPVQSLLDLQRATNKTISQTLHVINTTANSGWIAKRGSIVNMTIDELERRGAETGLILEVDEVDNVKKIQPNNIPQGLDRITNQLSEWTKYVAGIPDSMRGFDRADVAAKATVANQKAGAISLAVPFESLVRTRHYLAEIILKMVQHFYTEPRMKRVAPDALNKDPQTVAVNQPGPHGQILNDLTLGEYGVSVEFIPPHEAREQTQFARVIELLKAGVPIPNWAILAVSGLEDKERIMDDMDASAQAQSEQSQVEMGKTQAETQRAQADAQSKAAQAQLLQARVQEVLLQLQAVTPKDAQAATITQLQTALQREKLYLDDDYRHRQLAVDTLTKQQELSLKKQEPKEKPKNANQPA